MSSGLTFENVLALARSLGPPIKAPMILTTGKVAGVWRGSWQGQEYIVIDRAIEDQLRRWLATVPAATELFGGLPMMGIQIAEDDNIVAILLATGQ